MRLSKETIKELEELFGEAYEIGHTHALNAMREEPRMMDIGWNVPFKKALRLLSR